MPPRPNSPRISWPGMVTRSGPSAESGGAGTSVACSAANGATAKDAVAVSEGGRGSSDEACNMMTSLLQAIVKRDGLYYRSLPAGHNALGGEKRVSVGTVGLRCRGLGRPTVGARLRVPSLGS